jgi:hypothetical protein
LTKSVKRQLEKGGPLTLTDARFCTSADIETCTQKPEKSDASCSEYRLLRKEGARDDLVKEKKKEKNVRKTTLLMYQTPYCINVLTPPLYLFLHLLGAHDAVCTITGARIDKEMHAAVKEEIGRVAVGDDRSTLSEAVSLVSGCPLSCPSSLLSSISLTFCLARVVRTRSSSLTAKASTRRDENFLFTFAANTVTAASNVPKGMR